MVGNSKLFELKMYWIHSICALTVASACRLKHGDRDGGERSLAERNGVTEQLKVEKQMEWVRQMNACKAQVEEIVKFELIYD